MSYRGIATQTIKDLDFVLTCAACPEQYDVFDIDDGRIVGYVRLRWGSLTCEYPDCGGEVIYSAEIGDGMSGCFESEEQRLEHLMSIADTILKRMKMTVNRPVKRVLCVDNLDNGKGVFGLWRAGIKYDVVRYDEENEEWYIKDECGDTGVVDAEDFDEYFDKLEDDA